MKRIDILKLIGKISQRWAFHAVLMILGGISGILFSAVNKPYFEAKSVFSVTIDYTQTGALSDIQEDQAMRGVGSIIMSDQVLSQTVAQIAVSNFLEINFNDFEENAFLDREEFRWTLRFRDINPERAEIVARTWAESADVVIQEGLSHSQKAAVLTNRLDEMTLCLRQAPSEEISSGCGYEDQQALLRSIDELSEFIHTEKKASLGLMDALIVTLVNAGQLNPAPVYGQRNIFAICGVFAGLIASILFTAAREMRRSSVI